MKLKLSYTIAALLIATTFTSCKKDNTTSSTSGIPAGTTYYYQAKIGDSTYQQIVTDTNDFITGSSSGGTQGGDNEFGSDISDENGTQPGETALSITKGLFHNYDPYGATTNAVYKAFYAPGTYSYAAANSFDGIQIGWIDKSGTGWSTNDGTANQTGSVFTIVSATDAVTYGGTYYVTVTATFNCKLYDGNGNVLTVTNGKFAGDFGKL